MRVAGFVLYVIAFGLAEFCCLGLSAALGDDANPVAGVLLGGMVVVALGLAGAGYALRRQARRPPTTTLAFEVSAHHEVLPARSWRELPDPVPAAPRPASWHAPRLPDCPVPPDELLRRLWLVRAHLATYLTRSGRVLRAVGAILLVVVLFATAGLLGLVAGDPETDAEQHLAALLGAGLNAGVAVLLAVTLTVEVTAGGRRLRALQAEQHRLSTLDATRPGGAIGGPDIVVGSAVVDPSGYLPPAVPWTMGG